MDENITPYVSVLMPVYNSEKYVAEAIESILIQSFKDFEFLIIEDGSTDKSKSIIEPYHGKDSRIRILYNETNEGIVYSLNKGLNEARGKYIARMDADDISLPHRLETQVQFMDENKDIAASSAWMETIGKTNGRLWKSPVAHDEIMAKLFCHTCIWHPVSIIRKQVLDELDLQYDPCFSKAEDYKLWLEIARKKKLANIPEVLHKYRIHDHQKTKIPLKRKKLGKEYLQYRRDLPGIREEMLSDFLSRDLTLEEVEIHARLFFEIPFKEKEELKKLKKWVDYLISINRKNNKYTEPAFSRNLLDVYSKTKTKSFKYWCKEQKRFNPGFLWRLFFSGCEYYKGFSKLELVMFITNSFLFRKVKYF